MTAIFDRHCNCVGFYDENGSMVFSSDLDWIGFTNNEYFFRDDTNWCGGLVNGTFVDKSGKPVAWLEGMQPVGPLALLRPITPIKPLTPLRPLTPLSPLAPLTPLTPMGGWSSLSWSEYLAQS